MLPTFNFACQISFIKATKLSPERDRGIKYLDLGPGLDQQHCRFSSARLGALEIVYLSVFIINILIIIHLFHIDTPIQIITNIIFHIKKIHLHQRGDTLLVLGIDSTALAD